MNHVHSLLDTASVHRAGILGQGIGIAVIDTGIAPHPDLIKRQNRIVAFWDTSAPNQASGKPYDDNGHGTHVAGIAAGDGYSSSGTYCGIAPASHLIGIRILNRKGSGKTEDMLTAFDWILAHRHTYQIRIVNISIGCSSAECLQDGENSLLVQGAEKLWDAGLVVVAAAGNEGPDPMSITVPGISRRIITVGASDDQHTPSRRQDQTPLYSGRGPTTSCIRKPDIVAPGHHITSCRSTSGYTTKSGTSMATPMVSGAIALLLSAYPDMTNLEVKIRLKNSAVDLGLPHAQQGWGMLNVQKLIKRT